MQQSSGERRGFGAWMFYIYDKHYRKLLVLPMAMLVLAIVQISVQTALTGDFVTKGISLKGGSVITLLTSGDAGELQEHLLQRLPGADITVRSFSSGESLVIESDAQREEEISSLLAAVREFIPIGKNEYTVEITGAALGSSFFRQTFIAMAVAFLLMAIVVFLYFRTLVPSLAVVLAAFSDIVVTIAIFNLSGQKLSTAGIAAFLMLIGYSVDTDILLTSRVLKRRDGTVLERIIGAIKTGMTMTTTTLVAVIPSLLITNNAVIQQIMFILLIGLIVDIINTWIQNAAILRMYMEKHGTA